LSQLPLPVAYDPVTKNEHTNYQPFSVYPAMSRDIAMWVGEGTTSQSVIETISKAAGSLLVRTTLFDEFTKEGKTSYALRLVFQSKERTLTDLEVEVFMENVYKVALEQGFEVR
jgi:phenylalanyl-tRNA synthetase beta chain